MVRLLVTAGLLAIAAASPILILLAPRAQVFLCNEDGPIEWATAIAYLVAGVVFLVTAPARRLGRLWRVGLAALCLVVAGEEISWGQRILQFETPDAIAAVNVQGEFNLHNTAGVHSVSRRLGLLVVIALCLALPVFDRTAPVVRRLHRRLDAPVFPVWAIPVAVTAIALMAVPRVLFPAGTFNFHYFDEPGEFLISAAFLIFAIETMLTDRRHARARLRVATAPLLIDQTRRAA